MITKGIEIGYPTFFLVDESSGSWNHSFTGLFLLQHNFELFGILNSWHMQNLLFILVKTFTYSVCYFFPFLSFFALIVLD